MARAPSIPQADYDRLLELLRHEGYDINRINKVPHQW
jgi:apolipoprotein D and lipocalin family protein